MRHPRVLVHILALVACTLLASGCVTRGYKLADKDAPPVIAHADANSAFKTVSAPTPGHPLANAACFTIENPLAAPLV